MAKEHGYTDVRFSSVVIFREMLKPTADDLSWILQWLKAASSERERQCALEWGLQLWQQTGRSRDGMARIKDATSGLPDTRKQLWKYCHPGLVARATAFWYQRIRYRLYRHRARMAWRTTMKPFFKLRDTWNLWRRRGKLRSGEYVRWLAGLASEACGKSRDQWSPSDWSLLERTRGAKCAAAVKEGCRRVWERYEPPLPHERKPNEGVTFSTLAGLAGIKVSWQEGELKFADLTFEDACRATRYALSEAEWIHILVRGSGSHATGSGAFGFVRMYLR